MFHHSRLLLFALRVLTTKHLYRPLLQAVNAITMLWGLECFRVNGRTPESYLLDLIWPFGTCGSRKSAATKPWLPLANAGRRCTDAKNNNYCRPLRSPLLPPLGGGLSLVRELNHELSVLNAQSLATGRDNNEY